MDYTNGLIVVGVLLAIGCLGGLFYYLIKKIERNEISKYKQAEADGDAYVIPEEYNNVFLGVGSGVRFGFGFGIGIFFAGIVIFLLTSLFFGMTVISWLSGIAQ